MQDWDEFLDVSGRKYYYNSRTHEKSWKPPRKPRGSEGHSAPTSPDHHCQEQNNFDLITNFQGESKQTSEPPSPATEVTRTEEGEAEKI